MGLLNDKELIAALTVQSPTIPYVKGIVLPANPYSKESPVQGSSIDLHIGNIYLPGTENKEPGGIDVPKSDHSLLTGETAVVTTKETIHLPSDIAGIGLPPSTVSFRGLLMTNPGHVDPGYEGIMRFTVINMGKEPYHLNAGDRIVRLLLFRLGHPAHANWRERNPNSTPITQIDINRLSRDFVDVKKRAKKIAQSQGIKWSAGITIATTLVLGIFQLVVSGHLFNSSDIVDLKKRQDQVEYDIKNRVNIEEKLQNFDNRLRAFELTQVKHNAQKTDDNNK